MDGQMNGWMGGRADWPTDWRTDGRIDGWMDRYVHPLRACRFTYVCMYVCYFYVAVKTNERNHRCFLPFSLRKPISECMYICRGGCLRARACVCECVYACMCVVWCVCMCVYSTAVLGWGVAEGVRVGGWIGVCACTWSVPSVRIIHYCWKYNDYAWNRF